jgi:hypothetical protein
MPTDDNTPLAEPGIVPLPVGERLVLAVALVLIRWCRAGFGHSSIQMTADRYGHLFPRGDAAAELAAAERAFLTA